MRNLLAGYVVVFNGPPGSGKDTLATFIRGATSVVPRAFKDKLVSIALEISGVDRRTWDNWYDHAKERPRDQLWGHSCRSFLIMVSEDMIKPHLGNAYFGRAAADDIARNRAYLEQYGVCFTDSGFKEELQEVVNLVGPERVIVVHLVRHGSSFKNDSRNYLNYKEFPGVAFIPHSNNRPVEISASTLIELLAAEIDRRKYSKTERPRISGTL